MKEVPYGFKQHYYGNFQMSSTYYSHYWSGRDDWVFSKMFPNCSEVPEYVYDYMSLKMLGNQIENLEWDALIPQPPSYFTE